MPEARSEVEVKNAHLHVYKISSSSPMSYLSRPPLSDSHSYQTLLGILLLLPLSSFAITPPS